MYDVYRLFYIDIGFRRICDQCYVAMMFHCSVILLRYCRTIVPEALIIQVIQAIKFNPFLDAYEQPIDSQ